MFTTGSKWFFGVAGAALLAALVYGGATNPSEVNMATFTGVLTLGDKGGVGDHIGYAILLGIAASLAAPAIVAAAGPATASTVCVTIETSGLLITAPRASTLLCSSTAEIVAATAASANQTRGRQRTIHPGGLRHTASHGTRKQIVTALSTAICRIVGVDAKTTLWTFGAIAAMST